jgi:hypothetical protein
MNSGNSSSNPFIFSILSIIISFPPRRGQCLFPVPLLPLAMKMRYLFSDFSRFTMVGGETKPQVVSSMNIFENITEKLVAGIGSIPLFYLRQTRFMVFYSKIT